MNFFHSCISLTVFLAALCLAPSASQASNIGLSPEVSAIVDKIYSFDLDAAREDAHRFQGEHPDDPLGFLLEGEALWWNIFCTSADFKWGMTDARHRSKLESDQHYFDLAVKAHALALEHTRRGESAEMHFYAGLADAFAARLYALRGENRAAARAGVRGRQSFLRALDLDPHLADADFGLGLYNYYVDTLSSFARVLRFFMGIPGGSKQEGVRQLERAISSGVLTPTIARIYLALNLHRYDQQYARALEFLAPVAQKYSSNPLFQLMIGDLQAKLGHKDKALLHYRAAAALPVADVDCRKRIQTLAHSAAAAAAGSDAQHIQ
jgi:hypothetical protein